MRKATQSSKKFRSVSYPIHLICGFPHIAWLGNRCEREGVGHSTPLDSALHATPEYNLPSPLSLLPLSHMPPIPYAPLSNPILISFGAERITSTVVLGSIYSTRRVYASLGYFHLSACDYGTKAGGSFLRSTHSLD